jgi:DNA-binding FadR family transcriptional regulator
MGLVNTRNGSRATVTAQGDTLLAMSIASVVQVEKVGAKQVLGLLGALNAYAAELAADHASEEEIARLRAAAEQTAEVVNVQESAAALQHFFAVLSEISHNPLLAALCRFISDVQIGLAVKLSGGDTGDWGQVADSLQPDRVRIVDAVASRDPARAASTVRDYHRQAVERILSVRRGEELTGSDAGLTDALTAWLRANVGLGGQVASRRSTLS